MTDNNLRYALSEFLFTIYDHGTDPNALAEADAILYFLLEESKEMLNYAEGYRQGYDDAEIGWR